MGIIYSRFFDVHWKLAEAAYGILKKGYPNVPITLPFPNWRALFVDLKREMAEVKRKYKPGKEEKEKPKVKGKKRKSKEEMPNSWMNLPETYNEAKIPLRAALQWLGGIVPSLNSKWCRSCDLKEISHLRRLILFQKVCRIAFGPKEDWEKSAIQLEKDLFDQVVTKQFERKKQSVWALAMQDKLMDPLAPNAENIVMVEKEDLNGSRYAVGNDFMIVNADGSFGKFIYLSKPAPTLFKWLLDAGRAIEDQNFELGVKEAAVGKSTVAMFNEKFITLRSKRRCEKIARDYRYYGNRFPNTHPPSIILCFDDSQSDQILIIYTEMEGEKEIQFGSVSISVIKNTKKMLNNKKDEEIKGLRVYLNEGNLGGYCHIIQTENLKQGKDAFAPHFIYLEDAEKEDDCKNWLFKSRPQVILRRNEVNPLFGKTRMFNRHRICDVKPQKEYDLSRSFMRIDISRDHSGDELQEGETEDEEIPCKRRNQEAKSESPITQPSSTPALYNSTTESDCETLSNSIVESRPASEWNDPEKPGSSRLPWMDLVDDIYLEVKALKDLDSNHLSFPQFADAFMLRHQENQDDLQEGRLSRSNTRNRSRTTSSEFPASYSQSSIAQVSTSPSISSLSQTPDMHGLFQAKEFDDDNEDNGPIHF
ncbi:unnamed protein product, partial [Mesorhabditis belari]|uniref:Uncharacterized protein n=1 Tax=Mesorhabditis belari TaxID=2138241 RepID=A0AAF3F9M0_9BILA